MTKLIYEQRLVATKMHIINADSEFTSKYTDNQLDKSVKQQHSNVFSKVVLRCIIYPLGNITIYIYIYLYIALTAIYVVPFLVNIFGFSLQMFITATKSTPSYTLAMLDIIFSCLEGVFVAGVFFTDPAITSFMSLTYTGWHEKYVEQYVLVPKNNMNNSIVDRKLIPASSLTLTPSNSCQTVQPPSTAMVFHQQPKNNFLDIYNINRLSSVQSITEQDTDENFKCDKMKTVVMRRLHFESAHHNKKQQHQRMRKFTVIDFDIIAIPPIAAIRHNVQQPHPINTATSNTVKDIYVPYRYPFFATYFYNILTCFSYNNTTHNRVNYNTTVKQDYIDDFTNDILSPANSNSQSSTVIAITEDNHLQSKGQEQEKIDYYNIIYYDSSSSSRSRSSNNNTHKSMFDTHHI